MKIVQLILTIGIFGGKMVSFMHTMNIMMRKLFIGSMNSMKYGVLQIIIHD